MIIWTTNNKGQIARKANRMGGGEMVKTNTHIGPWRNARESAKGNGEKLVNIIHKIGQTATNTIHPTGH